MTRRVEADEEVVNRLRVGPDSRPLHHLVCQDIEEDGVPAFHESQPGSGKRGSVARDTMRIEVCGIGRHASSIKAETMPTEPSTLEGSTLFVVEIVSKPALLT
jgi:hypothetical protein